MADTSRSTSGPVAFLVIFVGILAAIVATQNTTVVATVQVVFSQYEIDTRTLSPEWVFMSRYAGENEESAGIFSDSLRAITNRIRRNEFSGDNRRNTLIGKERLRQLLRDHEQTVYFINPFIGILPLHIFFALGITFLISLLLPKTSGLAWMRENLYREYERVGTLLMKQFDAHSVDFTHVLSLPSDKREEYLRVTTLPEVVITEVEDYMHARRWVSGETANPFIPVAFYFRYRISETYGNIIQGLVSGGAAILIFVIGLRGLKFIPPEEPSLILMALSIEFILLIVLMISFAGSVREERLDRVVKELEAEQRDAIKQQTDTIHQFLERDGSGGGGGGAQESLVDYEEQKILDEVLALMLREAQKRRRG
jgi:hypothetical protein